MPIILTDTEEHLKQGDLLSDVQLFISGDGPEPLESTKAVVLSRDCNALRADAIVVALIAPYRAEDFSKLFQAQPPLSLDEARRLFAKIRDGDGSPDTFYLGPLPGDENEQARYAIRLDRIFTLRIPKKPSDRLQWIQRHRFGHLSQDSVRHLQVRFFGAFARQGFDDYDWWPTEDLRLMVDIGQRSVERREEEINGKRQHAAYKGNNANTKQIQKLERDLQEEQAQLDRYRKQLETRKAPRGAD